MTHSISCNLEAQLLSGNKFLFSPRSACVEPKPQFSAVTLTIDSYFSSSRAC